MENIRSCLDCSSFAVCDVLGIFKDDDGRIPVDILTVIASDCKKYLK
jgi:hypothetical protein